jgi:Methyltransferase FkbM domain
MPDIRKTSKHNNGTSIKTTVTGITLSTLLRNTLGRNIDGSGGSLLIKMDVEGAEFGVLKEVAASNVLCEYARSGNNATLVVEFHQHLITDPDDKREALAGLKDAKDKLRRCGIKLRNLPDFWT